MSAKRPGYATDMNGASINDVPVGGLMVYHDRTAEHVVYRRVPATASDEIRYELVGRFALRCLGCQGFPPGGRPQ